jgi:hypothetical protein
MATVTLSFDPVGDDVRESLESKPETHDAAVLEETQFFMPVHFAIDGVQILDLRENDPNGYLPLPLLGFCASLNRAVDKIRPGVLVDGYLAGGGDLRFLEEGGRVKVWCTLNDRPGYATRQELVAAARKFREDVRDWLLKNAPALRTHKNWTEWFPGAMAYPQ